MHVSFFDETTNDHRQGAALYKPNVCVCHIHSSAPRYYVCNDENEMSYLRYSKGAGYSGVYTKSNPTPSKRPIQFPLCVGHDHFLSMVPHRLPSGAHRVE